ncbi:MAG: DsrE family protein [Pirellulaceae bacterium]|jgi:intracellular sulfur oxidation DsrE/DsrF family protein|nr:DsrE family protein [Pirellulaceae bacterium]
MGRTIALFIILSFGALAIAPTFAQDQPGQRRGQGFGGGRGPGFGQGRAMRHHAANQDQADKTQQPTYPAIANYGGVVQLPAAAQQPRAGTQLLVDLTSGSDADKLNAGLEQVARFVNLYAGGGAEPADVRIAVVFHGDATLAVLNPEAYAAKFQTDGNPNLKLLQQLSDSGVDLYVCGQSLISKGSAPSDVAMFVKTAVSALTTVVNLQADGYAYLPIAQATANTSPKPGAAAAKQVDNLSEDDHAHRPEIGRGMGRGLGARQGMQGDMATVHAMFDARDKIKRTIKNLPDGAEAITESDDEAIADMLKEHVPAMEDRVLGNRPLPPMTFHPIFVELIKHAEDYTLTHEETDKGMKVKYQSDDPYVVMLVQEHAKLISRFIKNGMEELHTPYQLPKSTEKAPADGLQED